VDTFQVVVGIFLSLMVFVGMVLDKQRKFMKFWVLVFTFCLAVTSFVAAGYIEKFLF